MALTRLEIFNKKAVVSKENEKYQSLELDDRSTQQKGGIWNDFLASYKKVGSNDIDDKPKPLK